MSDRPKNPKPDPLEVNMFSERPVFDIKKFKPESYWLPDATAADNCPEHDLEPQDELDTRLLSPLTAVEPKFGELGRLPQYVAEVARWAFNTQIALLHQRLRVYNRYRRLVNQASPSCETRGRYRRACRLAVEQLLMRPLPVISAWDWNYPPPNLPLFDMVYFFTWESTSGDEFEVVRKLKLNCTVETRVRANSMDTFLSEMGEMRPKIQEEWSSSSSSSSESEFDPS